MNIAIELCLDEHADARIREIWERIERAGLPSRLLELGHAPHVSLGVCADLDRPAFAAKLAEFAAREPKLHGTFVSLGTFSNRQGVVFLGLINTRELIDMHARFDALFATSARDPWEYYRPGRWVPHCTLTTALDPIQVAVALRVCAEVPLPIQATLESVAIVENPDGVVHARLPLSGRSGPAR
ncbi:MAG: 2'-5' RNA ligase family protein [Myxococcota bacterium]